MISTTEFNHNRFEFSHYLTISNWCNITFGENNWGFRSSQDTMMYYFKNEMDLSLFTLKFPGLFVDSDNFYTI